MPRAAAPMTADRWERVKQLIEEALGRSSADRAAFLAALSADDAELAKEVESLLTAHLAAGSFIQTPALARPDINAALGAPAEIPPWAGRRVGPYLLVREIGRGGMGAVYLAIRADDEYRKQVAIKVIGSGFAPASLQQRFRHERQILADLDHPNIARLIDGGSTEDGSPYFVMEYVDGLPLERYCESLQLSIEQRLALFLQVCGAVAYAHQHLVVHRDLKSSNTIVGADGIPKLLDFGIAKLLGTDMRPPDERTMTGMHAMSFESASPEQVRGELVTTRTDVYALGVMLHRLLTGSGPYNPADAATPHDLARAICDADARRPSEVVRGTGASRRLRGDLDTIVLKALQKDPTRRYASVEQFAQDITRHLGGRPVLAQPDTIRYRTTKFISRHKAGVAASALLFLSLVVGVIATGWQAHVAGVQRGRAERRFNDVRRLATSFLFEFHDAIENLPGSTKARELVVRRANEYLDSLASESANDSSLQRELAAAYDKVGDVQGLPSFPNLGDTDGALKSHRRALELRRLLVAGSPADAALQRDLGTTESHMSAVLVVTKDFPSALAHAQRALTIREAVLAGHPGGVPERNALAAGYHQVAAIMSSTEDWDGALRNTRKEAGEFEALLALDPGNGRAQRNVAIAYRQLGAQLERGGDPVAAVAYYRKAAVLDEGRVRINPDDGLARLDLSYDYASIGYTLSTRGEFESSLASYQEALLQREHVAAADPNDANATDTVTRAHLSIGVVLGKAGRPADAIVHYVKARDIAAARFARDPSNKVAGARLAAGYGGLASAHSVMASAARRQDDALAHWRAARAAAQKGLEIWTADATATRSAAAQKEVDTLTVLVARCDTALGARAAPARR